MNKTAFITGATSGFGWATAVALAKENYNLIILGRRAERLDELEKEICSVKIHKIAADVRDKERIFSEIANLPDEFKNIEILVNNAGLALGQERVNDANLDDFETMIDTNIKGLHILTKLFLKEFNKRNEFIFCFSITYIIN